MKLGSYIAAAIEQRSAAGPELEFNESMGIAGNRFPLELLAPPDRPEQRAVTGLDSAVMPRRWLDRLFSGAASQSLGITMESVPVGVASYPVTSAGASAAQRGKDEAAGDTAWTIGVKELKPKRNAATLKFSIEDTARIPGLESALTRDLCITLVEVESVENLWTASLSAAGMAVYAIGISAQMEFNLDPATSKGRLDDFLKAGVDFRLPDDPAADLPEGGFDLPQ